MNNFFFLRKLDEECGAVAIIVGVLLFALIGSAALAIDLGNLFAAKNELQNAADAGALAGCRVLYHDTGAEVNWKGFTSQVDNNPVLSANQVAHDAATANYSQKANDGQNVPVEVDCTYETNDGDVQRGHWSFGTQTFNANASQDALQIANYTTEELDVYDPANPFINAVRVKARRKTIPISSFFAKIFGYQSFQYEAEAIAYLGFTSSINKEEIDLPLAICQDSILDENSDYACNIGRVINDGNDTMTSETGTWTNFESDSEDCGNNPSVNDNDFSDMDLCNGELNPSSIGFDDKLATNNGALTVLSGIYDCFIEKLPNQWVVTLLVIDCENASPTCAVVEGAVSVSIVWITEIVKYEEVPTEMKGMYDNGVLVKGDDGITPLYADWGAPSDSDVKVNDNSGEPSLYAFMKELDQYQPGPVGEDWNAELEKYFDEEEEDGTTKKWYQRELDDFFEVSDSWSNSKKNAAGMVRWASFIRHFNLKNITVNGEEKPAPYANNSIYFLPNCSKHELAGQGGGENFGVLAKIPVLVH